ncbi:phage portal protein [Arsenicitalea aurantiaca]|uniref:Phage portal protein n=1 Tax=Arsenicitalea aurantiaca TaxID=1783274 RepID=A0A433XGQ6_9HYPH|nr:phage portal protein [Arsenicitalea aurantiaca]
MTVKAAQAVVRNLAVRDLDSLEASRARADSGETVTDQTVLGLSAVWACVNLLSGTIASLPLMVYRTRADGERVVARDHPLYRVLHDSPNYDQTALDFWEFLSASLELWGNAYARIQRTAGVVTSLHPVNPRLVAVRRLTNGDIEYRWSQDGRYYVETDRTMLHIRGFGGDPLGGMSTLSFGIHAFGLARAAQRAAGATFANGMRPSVQLVFDKFLSEEQEKLAEGALVDKYTGAMNAGRPFVAQGGAKVEAISINPVDAQLLEIMSLSVEEVCRYFQVPPVMIGHTSKSSSWPSSVEQQGLILQKFTLRRRLKRIEQACEKQMLTPADRGAGITIEFNIEGLLRADSAGRARFYQVMTMIGAMTINEVRALENWPMVEGGDVPRMQMQQVPITDAGKEADEDNIRDTVRRLLAEEQD